MFCVVQLVFMYLFTISFHFLRMYLYRVSKHDGALAQTGILWEKFVLVFVFLLIVAFKFVTLYSLVRSFQNNGNNILDYMMSWHRWPQLKSWFLWKPVLDSHSSLFKHIHVLRGLRFGFRMSFFHKQAVHWHSCSIFVVTLFWFYLV